MVRPYQPGGAESGLSLEELTAPEWATASRALPAEQGAPAVQRLEAARPASAPRSESTQSSGVAPAGPDLDQLAQQVYSILKNRLRAEYERHI